MKKKPEDLNIHEVQDVHVEGNLGMEQRDSEDKLLGIHKGVFERIEFTDNEGSVKVLDVSVSASSDDNKALLHQLLSKYRKWLST